MPRFRGLAIAFLEQSPVAKVTETVPCWGAGRGLRNDLRFQASGIERLSKPVAVPRGPGAAGCLRGGTRRGRSFLSPNARSLCWRGRWARARGVLPPPTGGHAGGGLVVLGSLGGTSPRPRRGRGNWKARLEERLLCSGMGRAAGVEFRCGAGFC